jgi:predicted PurR-regulated permease PerM
MSLARIRGERAIDKRLPWPFMVAYLLSAEAAMSVTEQRAIRRQAMFWTAALIAFLLILYVLGDMLLPFIAGMALAYFLDPVADMLERWGIGRLAATIVILVCFVIAFILALLIIVPVLGAQIAGFLERVPDYIARLQRLLAGLDYEWLDWVRTGDDTLLAENSGELLRQGAAWTAALVERLWASGMALINILSLIIVTPVVAFYLLYDWDRMVAKVDSWLPRDHRDTILAIARDIDDAVAGFVRGQGTLCLVLGIFYGGALTIVGLNFGLLIGLFAGLISFIPYVGSITGFLLSVSVALVQFWPNLVPIAIVAVIFFAGQFIEGNILQPKLVGSRVGLHPVWVMFALFAFGVLFGFTGLLVAVPAAAAIGVVTRYALGRYLRSELYRGRDRRQMTAAPGDSEPDDRNGVGRS